MVKFSKNWPFILFLLFFIFPMLGKKGIVFLIVLALFFAAFLKIKNKMNQGNFGNFFNNLFKNNPDKSAVAFDPDNLKNMNKSKKLVTIAIILFLGAWLFFSSIQIVDAGETGVYSLFGKVKEKELSSGIHFVIPLAKVTRMSVRTEEYTMSIAVDEGRRSAADAITTLTKEGLNVDLDMTVLYHLQEEKASDIYREIGLAYDEKIIRPTIRTAIRDVIAQYEAKDIYSQKREEAGAKIQEQLAASMSPRGVVIETVLLRNVVLPANLATAIQEKLQAEQEAEKYDFILDKEKKEKQRKVIEAEGQRDAQKIINESLTTNYLYYQYISSLKDRQGTIYVPTSPDTGMPMFKNLGN